MRAHRLRCREHIHHVGRYHQVPKPESREEHGGETSTEDHDARAIEALHGGNRPPRVAIFAVVVVFENQRARSTCPLQQRKTAPQAHGDAQRELVCWSDVDETCMLPSLQAAFQVETLGVDGHAANLRTQRTKHHRRSRISRLLHPHWLAWIEQQAGCSIERFLRARNNQHLFGRALHSARSIQIFGHGLTQRSIP